MSRFSLLFLVASFACGSDPTESGQQRLCTQESRGEVFVAGFERMSEAEMFQARILEANPAPPDRGNNTWMLEIAEPGGAPMTDATSVRVKAWMPDHGHGTNPLWNEGSQQGDGRFTVGPFNLFMPGLWQFTVEVNARNQTDDAVVSFCVEG